jgi:formate dehydrogenase subunit delta
MSETAPDESRAAPESAAHGGADQLVRMANDIGNFFRAEPNREDAIVGIANHVSKYWTQRMRDKLAAYLKSGEKGLDELPREAFARVALKL